MFFQGSNLVSEFCDSQSHVTHSSHRNAHPASLSLAEVAHESSAIECQRKHDYLNGVAPATLAIELWLSGSVAAHVANINTPKTGNAVEQ